MKRLLKFFILFLFVFNFFNKFNIVIFKNTSFAHGENYSYSISYDDKVYEFKDIDFKPKLSKKQKENYQNLNTFKFLKQLHFSEEEILTYLFPETSEIFSKVSKLFLKEEISDKVLVVQNKCKLEFIEGEKGKVVNRQKFFNDCFEQIENNKKNISINLEIIDYKNSKNAKELFSEKSCFSTSFLTSSEERKNNIKLALKALDGLVIEEGEIFSFNKITGERNEAGGYKKAKII